MKFYVIYDFDLPQSTRVSYCKPPRFRAWELTECDDASEEYDYLGTERGNEPLKTKHRKYCGLLNREQFERFVSDCYLEPEECETMGSLTGLGWLPAIAFRYSYGGYSEEPIYCGAYVTPIPQRPDGSEREGMTERDWDRLRKVILAHYS